MDCNLNQPGIKSTELDMPISEVICGKILFGKTMIDQLEAETRNACGDTLMTLWNTRLK